MIIKIKNVNFSTLGLGKINPNYEAETNDLISVASYSAEKTNAIDVFFKSVKSFKTKIRSAFLLNENFGQSKFNLFNTTKTLLAIGNPTIDASGFLSSVGNILNTKESLNNENGAIFFFQNNAISEGFDGVAVGVDGGSGTQTFYASKDLLNLGARGTFGGGVLQTNATKYLSRGSMLFGSGTNNDLKLYIDGEIKGTTTVSSGITTGNIYIGGFETSNYYKAKIGFVALFNDLPTDAEVMILHNAVSQLMTDLGM